MPRSGSTLQYDEMVQICARRTNCCNLGYWKLHEHRTDRRAAVLPRGCRQLTTKVHEFDSSLLNVCQRTVVFVTARNLLDIAASAARNGWLSASQTAQSPRPMARWVTNAALWHSFGGGQWIRYTDLLGNRTAVVELYRRALQIGQQGIPNRLLRPAPYQRDALHAGKSSACYPFTREGARVILSHFYDFHRRVLGTTEPEKSCFRETQ